MPGLLAFGASLDLFFEWGLEDVSRRISTGPAAVRELAASAGWTVYRLARDRRTARRSWCSRKRGVDPGRRGR